MCKIDWLGPGGVSIPVYFDIRRDSVIMDSNLYVETLDSFHNLLEVAANNDVEGFERFLDQLASRVDEVGAWYGRQKGSNQIVLQQRTPLMVAATYGSFDVVKLIVSLPDVDMNRSCGVDKSTALHCAASSGSAYAVDVVKLLLASGADPNIADADGLLPFDVIVVSPKFPEMKNSLQMMLATDMMFEKAHNLRVSIETPDSPPFSPAHGHESLFSPSQLAPSPKSARFHDIPMPSAPEKKEYPVDPSLPDIKNGIYSTDEFRMFSFKVRPCSRAYSHDWTECPFVHPGENARRRDPRKYHYSCVPCPDFRKGACRRGDMCEYAHGVFESWLHPAHYRTRLCKDGTSCNRRVCFFAHTQDELRPLYVSTGSAIPSPRSNTSAANAMDFAAAMSLLPGSPSIPMMSPSPFSPPISPSTNGISSTGWQSQHNVPLLHLPGSNLQSSRLRSSLNARDILTEGSSFFPEVDVQQQQQLLNELSLLQNSSISTNLLNRSTHPKMPSPSNLEDIFSAENSPRYSDQAFGSTVFSPSHKAAALYQFQQQQQSMLSPIRTNFSPRNIDHSLLKTPIRVPSPGRLSPRSIEPISPMSARTSLLAQREKLHQPFRSLSSRELGSNVAAADASSEDTWPNWVSPNGAPEWSVHADEFGKIKRSLSSELLNNGEEPDLSWVQSLVKESGHDMNENSVAGTSMSMGENLSNQMEEIDESVLGAWLEQMQLDQLMAQ
ncbi:zinc finger CCCH domain-containing protein 30-like [Primulina eburnea]|uniref:zinc finger CCCH domain-containing protein 30-like n=1 Tax=Primulina eburnea TaxID=1245227 RepID=UPI003C6BE158